MAGITLAQAQEQLDAALDNLKSVRKIAESQVTGTTGGRKTVYQSLADAQADVDRWDRVVRSLSRCGGIITQRAVPID